MFLKEIIQFSKDNWWIFIIFFICLLIIWYTNTWNIYEVFLVFSIHFIWDIFMMIMWKYYILWENKKWNIFQISSTSIFTFLWFYAWIFNWKWHYLRPQLLFIFAWIKWFISHKISDFYKNIIFIILFIITLFIYFYFSLFIDLSSTIQIIWFLSLSTGLFIQNKNIIFFWILFITIWSFLSIYVSFLNSNIKWIDISYFLLPLTVLVFYVKSLWKK